MYIEFIGPPGSGKTYFLEKLLKFFKKKKILHETPREVFINLYLKKNTNSSKIKKYFYKYYFNLIGANSNFLFKKETNDLKYFIQKEIQSSKKIKTLVKTFNNFLKDKSISSAFLKRMIFNFKIDCIGIIKKKRNHKILVCEEGIYQKFYLNFKSKKNKKSNKEILNAFSIIKKPKIILFFNYSIKDSINRAEKRKKGFKYFVNRKFILDNKNYFNNYLIEFAKKKKINVLNIYLNKKIKIDLDENFTRWVF